jgi:hypothetical protein
MSYDAGTFDYTGIALSDITYKCFQGKNIPAVAPCTLMRQTTTCLAGCHLGQEHDSGEEDCYGSGREKPDKGTRDRM